MRILILIPLLLFLLVSCGEEETPVVPLPPEPEPIQGEIKSMDKPDDPLVISPEVIELEGVEEKPKEFTIYIEEQKYNPKSITIEPGTIVTWVNKDNKVYKINEKSKKLIGERIGPEEEFTFTFEEPGTYQIFDSIHTFIQGEIIVEEREDVLTGMTIFGSNVQRINSFVLAFIMLVAPIAVLIYIKKEKKKK
ncbi:cupredoxin domain-containing protein [Nanoarchaeota archaeon]